MKRKYLWILLPACALACGCARTEMILPTGPEGPRGNDGLSAYAVWVASVLGGELPGWDGTRIEVYDYFRYLKGEKGDTGASGSQGLSAYEVWKAYIASGGVEDPADPGRKWDPSATSEQDFFRFITGARGDDGAVPYIGANGNWWIGTADTGIQAQGLPGEKGDSGEKGEPGPAGTDGSASIILIGENGNWWIDGIDTGVSATGQTGAAGANGKSAYELWVEAVCSDAGLDDPHHPGQRWDPEKTDLSDFWEYLRGEDGADGEDGEGSVRYTGDSDLQFDPDTDRYNVIAVAALYHSVSADKRDTTFEFVHPAYGSVAYLVLAPGCYKAGEGTQVTFKATPSTGLSADKTYRVDGYGCIYMPAADLPEQEDRTEGDSGTVYGSEVISILPPGKAAVPAAKIAERTCLFSRVHPSVEIIGAGMSIKNGYFSPSSSGSSAAYCPRYVRIETALYRTIDGVRSRFSPGESFSSGEAAALTFLYGKMKADATKDGYACSYPAPCGQGSHTYHFTSRYVSRPVFLDDRLQGDPDKAADYLYWITDTELGHPCTVTFGAENSGAVVGLLDGDLSVRALCYGEEVVAENRVDIPAISLMGDLDESKSRYTILLGETTIDLAFDIPSFGFLYENTFALQDDGTFVPTGRYASLSAWLAAKGAHSLPVLFYTSGDLASSHLVNKTQSPLAATLSNKNAYDGFYFDFLTQDLSLDYCFGYDRHLFTFRYQPDGAGTDAHLYNNLTGRIYDIPVAIQAE